MPRSDKVYLPGGRVFHQTRGRGILLDGGHGGQSAYSSPEEMKTTVRGGRIADDIVKRVQELRPREIHIPKRGNIKF
jgi:hypothetical protein